ncbi:MAG: peptidase M61, partial [Terriglobales bacterium]
NGFTQGGYKLVYNDVQSEWTKHQDPTRGVSFATSLGFSVNGEGNIGSVWWNSLAFKAGIVPDMQLQAVNDQKYTAAVLREAIVAAEKTKDPIKLLLKNGDQFLTINLDYHGGPRYPHLERVEGTEDRLDAVLAPSK